MRRGTTPIISLEVDFDFTGWELFVTFKNGMKTSTGFSGGTVVIQHPYTDASDSNYSYSRYWATETGIKAYTNSTSRYWRSGRTYKWIAVWAPTS